MAKRVPADRLSTEVEKILNEYGENVQQNLGDIVKAMSKNAIIANIIRYSPIIVMYKRIISFVRMDIFFTFILPFPFYKL